MVTNGNIKLIFGGIVLVYLLGPILGLSAAIISKLTEWGTSMLSNALTSNIAGSLVQTTTGNMLKTTIFRFSIGLISVSISAFVVAKFLVARSIR